MAPKLYSTSLVKPVSWCLFRHLDLGERLYQKSIKLNMVEGQFQCQKCILKASVYYLLLLILWHYDILLVKGHYSFIIFHFS